MRPARFVRPLKTRRRAMPCPMPHPVTAARMDTTELPTPVLAPYTHAQVRFAGAAWPMRAAEELRSAQIFRALARAASVAGMPEPWPARFAATVRDEVRHARLCVTVGKQLGAAKPQYDIRPVRTRLSGLPDPLMRAAALLLVEVAMGETISMYLFRAGRRSAVEPLTRAALGAIVSDEVRHQRLGWTGFAFLWPMLTEPLRAAARREAAHGLAACERQIARPAMRWLQRRQPFDPAYAALGVLNPEARVEAFYWAVERLVLPRLTRLGIDGPLAWQNRYRSP
jgi:hypothetical protein